MNRGVIIGAMVMIALAVTVITSAQLTSKTPSNRITEDNIHIYKDKVIIDVEGASWSQYADTDSMIPILDKGANGIEIIPKSQDDLFIGDIVAYESEQGLIIHRIVGIEEKDGIKYFELKGDNNSKSDPEKVTFEKIKYVTIMLVY